MAINPIQLNNIDNPADEGQVQRRRLQGAGGDKSFGDMIQNAIESVDESSKVADGKMQDLVAGKTENVHDVMMSMTKAQMSFELMTEIRNRLVETYQTVSRMQI